MMKLLPIEFNTYWENNLEEFLVIKLFTYWKIRRFDVEVLLLFYINILFINEKLIKILIKTSDTIYITIKTKF